MPLLIFEFEQEINVSAQVGDTAYYVPTTTSAQFQVNSSDIIEIGPITFVNPNGLGFWCFTTLVPGLYPNSSDYIFFSKDNKANQSNVLGYYAKVKIKNNSQEEAEIHAITADCFESSK